MGEVSAADVRAWAVRSADLLESARERLDAANLFPVPDHDTGTNLAVTARAAADAVTGETAGDHGPADVAETLRRLATGAVRSARGNSGVILSQVLRGFADSAAASGGVLDLRHALGTADTAARAAVGDPVEGTMLTVARAAAAVAAGGPDEVARAAVAAARAVLATPGPATEPGAGTDAGALGLVLVYEALAEVLTGETVASETAPATTGASASTTADHTGTPGGPAYEVQYLLDLPPGADAPHVVGGLAEVLGPLGDSLVLADDGAGLWAVHVHVDDVGAAIEAGAAGVAHGGAMSQVRVTRFADTATPAAVAAAPSSGRRAVVVASGPDLRPARTLFAELDVTVLGPGEDFPAGEVVVVAVGEAAIAAAMRHADQAAGVSVVPARAVVQAVAAVAVHDPARRGVDDTVAMAEAAAGCRHASLTVAGADGLTIVGVAHAGDVLGLLGDEIAVIGPDHDDVARRLLDRLLAAGGELVTLLHRSDSLALAERLVAYVHWLGDHLDVELRDVGPDLDSPVLVGVE